MAAHGRTTGDGDPGRRNQGLKNVYTDTSIRNAEYMYKAVELFGEDRVMFATDYPFFSFKHSLEQCEKLLQVNRRIG